MEKSEDRFDDLIKKYASQYDLPWLLIKAQIWQESKFDPDAQSPCGAKGLMQLMPATAEEIRIADCGLRNGETEIDLTDPETNIRLGVKYDRVQYDHFNEIPKGNDRLKFMLASYNCGRGYVNIALRLAREEEFDFKPLALIPGKWQTWDFTCRHLASPYCFIEIKGKRTWPDWGQVLEYVEKIWRKYQQYSSELGVRS